MQTPTPAVTQTPEAPAAPPAPGSPEVVVVTSSGAPITARQLEAIRARRAEISKQLNSAADRRQELAAKLRGLDPAARPGIEERIALLDRRILALEGDLEKTGNQLASAPAGLVATSGRPNEFDIASGNTTAIATTFTVFVLAPLALASARLLWKRASFAPRLPSTASAESNQRLDRIEQAIEAIAIEVERVSEGQRFVTRLLAEGNKLPGVDGERVAERVPVGGQERVPRGGG